MVELLENIRITFSVSEETFKETHAYTLLSNCTS